MFDRKTQRKLQQLRIQADRESIDAICYIGDDGYMYMWNRIVDSWSRIKNIWKGVPQDLHFEGR